MAMRLYTPAELASELMRRGCEMLDGEEDANGTYWQFDGKVFQVPRPEEDQDRYPDWMLDHLIRTHGLPPAARKH